MTEEDTYNALMRPSIGEFVKMVQEFYSKYNPSSEHEWYQALNILCKSYGWTIRQFFTELFAARCQEVPQIVLLKLDKYNF